MIASVTAPEIFRAGILAVPRLGCINVHSGRPPVYRGMMPTFWRLLHGEKHAVITVHEMVEELDAGAMLARSNGHFGNKTICTASLPGPSVRGRG